MKSIYIMIGASLAVLLLGASMVWLLVSQVETVLEECAVLTHAAAEENMEEAAAAVDKISALVDRYRYTWHLLANHNDLDDIESALLGVRMAVEQENMEELGVLCVELEQSLLHISEKELPNLRNII